MPPTENSLDPQVVAMAKAIRQAESGNRAVLPQEGAGVGGASRYQYTHDTWGGVAQKYLGDAKAPLTLENENKASYLRIIEFGSSLLVSMNVCMACAPPAATFLSICGVITPTTLPAAFKSGFPTISAALPSTNPPAV